MYGYAPYGYADLGVAGSGAGGTLNPALPTPELTFTGGLETYPPAVQVDIEPGYEAGDQLELRYATTYANLIAGTYAGGGQVPLGTPPYDFGLASITSPAITFMRARLHRGLSYSSWSTVIMHGDADAPTFTAGPSYGSTAENAGFTFNVTTNVETTIAIVGGADQALFSVDSPSAISTSHAITMSAADYETHGATADVQFRVTNLANNYSAQTATVTITDQDEIPNAFTFTDQTGVTPSTVYTSNTITVAGLGTGVTVPVTVTGGEYQKNSGAWTTSAGTATNGDTFAVRHTSSPSGLVVNTILTIGAGSDTFSTAGALVEATHRFTGWFNTSYGSGPATFNGITIASGDKVVIFAINNGNGTQNITGITANSGAITFTRIGGMTGSAIIDGWYADTSGVTSLDISVALSGSSQRTGIAVVSVTGAPSGLPASSNFAEISVGGSEVNIDVDAGLSAPSNGVLITCVDCGSGGGKVINWTGSTEVNETNAESQLTSTAIQTTAANITIEGYNFGALNGPRYEGVRVGNITFAP